MMDGSWYHRKADECARKAADSPDPGRRLSLEGESRLWRQIARSEAQRDEVPQRLESIK
jgi:hypothetical protein